MLLEGFVLPPHARQVGAELLMVLGLESDEREGRAVASDCPSDPGVGTGGDSLAPFTAVWDRMRDTRSSNFSSRWAVLDPGTFF